MRLDRMRHHHKLHIEHPEGLPTLFSIDYPILEGDSRWIVEGSHRILKPHPMFAQIALGLERVPREIDQALT